MMVGWCPTIISYQYNAIYEVSLFFKFLSRCASLPCRDVVSVEELFTSIIVNRDVQCLATLSQLVNESHVTQCAKYDKVRIESARDRNTRSLRMITVQIAFIS